MRSSFSVTLFCHIKIQLIPPLYHYFTVFAVITLLSLFCWKLLIHILGFLSEWWAPGEGGNHHPSVPPPTATCRCSINLLYKWKKKHKTGDTNWFIIATSFAVHGSKAHISLGYELSYSVGIQLVLVNSGHMLCLLCSRITYLALAGVA